MTGSLATAAFLWTLSRKGSLRKHIATAFVSMIREVSGVLGMFDFVRTLDCHPFIGRWGGSRVVRFSPTGDIDFQLIFPTALNVTACCFGGNPCQILFHISYKQLSGPNNDHMFVTTAHCSAVGGDPTRQEQYPDSGNIFFVDLSGIFKGVERHFFAA